MLPTADLSTRDDTRRLAVGSQPLSGLFGMSVEVPNRTITRRICVTLRAGQPIDLACTTVGVDALTLKRWLALGEAASRQGEEEDPHCRFFEAVSKALGYADQARDLKDRATNESGLQAPGQPRDEPRRAGRNQTPDHPPLAWLVVEEAPIEIVIGSRPPWVYETPPAPDPGQTTEAFRTTLPEDVPFEDAPTTPVEPDEAEPRCDEPIGEDLAVIAVGLVFLAILAVAVLLILLMIPVVLAGFTAIGAIRTAVGLAYRWRAGLITLSGGGSQGLAIPGPIGRPTWRSSLRLPKVDCLDRTAGSVAWADRSPPQRE